MFIILRSFGFLDFSFTLMFNLKYFLAVSHPNVKPMAYANSLLSLFGWSRLSYFIVQRTLYTQRTNSSYSLFTLYIVQHTVYTQSAGNSGTYSRELFCSLCMYTSMLLAHILCTVCIVHCTIYIVYSLHSAYYSLQSALYSWQCVCMNCTVYVNIKN